MRKLLIFLIVFGAGLALLLWFEGRRSARAPLEPPPPAPMSEDEEAFTELPLPLSDAAPDEPSVIRVIPEGAFEATTFVDLGDGIRRRHYRVQADRLQHLGEGAYDAEGLVVTMFDPETESLRGELNGEMGRIRLEHSDGSFRIDPAYPMTLHGVEGTVFEGLPLSPLTISVPVLEGVVERGILRSKESVVITGRDLRATGEGLDVDQERRTFTLRERGTADLALDDGVRVTLSSQGPLITRELEGPGAAVLEIEARTGARLVFSGSRDAQLFGDTIVLRGRGPGSGESPFRLTSVTAIGNVRYQTEDGDFRAESARLFYDEDGSPLEAILETRPRVQLLLSDLDPDDPGGEVGEKVEVVFEGRGPLKINLASEGGEAFALAGPATMDVQSFQGSVQAAGGFRGERTSDGRFGELNAFGGVRAELARADLTADAVQVGVIRSGQVNLLSVSTEGETDLTGTLDDGRAFEFSASGGMEYLQSEDGFFVPEARGAALAVHGEDPIRASADLVRDFVASTLAFGAEGNVDFDASAGRGSGSRLVHRGLGAGELTGSTEDLARFEFRAGELTARSIEYAPGTMTGRDEAVASWATPDRRFSVEAPWIVMRQDETTIAGDTELSLEAGGRLRLIVHEQDTSYEVESDTLSVVSPAQDHGQEERVLPRVTAEGRVVTTFSSEFTIRCEGETFRFGESKAGRITAREGERVRASGTLPRESLRFDMGADEVSFWSDRFEAVNPDAEIVGLDVSLSPGAAEVAEGSLRAIAGHMDADATSILFSDSAYLGRMTAEDELWSLDAAEALLTIPEETEGAVPVSELFAWGGFIARFGPEFLAGGERIEVSRATGKVSMWGAPVVVRMPGLRWDSETIEWDLRTGFFRSTRGKIIQTGSSEQQGPWSLSFETLQPREGPDATVQVMRDPVIRNGSKTVRASWAVLWVDSREWARSSRLLSSDESDPERIQTPDSEEQEAVTERPIMPSLFGELGSGPLSRWIQEFYLDGNIEFLEGEERQAHAEAFYLDLLDGHGWLHDAELSVDMPLGLGLESRRLVIHAEWLRHSADGSLHADSAVMTSCNFEEPHFEIESGELKVKPKDGSRGTRWAVSLKENSISFPKGPRIPLPPISFPMNEKYKVPSTEVSVFGIQPLSIGDSARYGAFVSTGFVRELGSASKGLHGFFRKILPDGPGSGGGSDGVSGPEFPEGRTKVSGSVLWSRGGLVDVGTSISSPGLYRFETDTALIYDTGDDRGLLRVPSSDREEFRLWSRGRGRFLLGEEEWVDAVYSVQTDAGVQAEFFESEYLRFEERETYLHWRKARGEKYTNVTVSPRTDDFRTAVEELPSAGFYQGRKQIANAGPVPLLYTSNSTAAYLNRREGSFESPFADGLGEEGLVRLDTTQRVEAPAHLGVLGLHATPYVEGRLTAWENGEDPSSTPLRAAALAGLEFATTFWRAFEGGSKHLVTPSLGIRDDLGIEEQGKSPPRFDQTEDSLEGRFVDFKVRSVWESADADDSLDVEVALTHAEDVATGQLDGLLPIEINSEFRTSFGDTLVGVFHDGRVDTEHGDTAYSRTLFGIEPDPAVAFGVSHHSGRDAMRARLFEAVSLDTRWRVSRKFELEASHTISTLSDRALRTGVLARRYGHDFVFELEFSFQAGEGGNSISFDLIPLIAFKEPGFGQLKRWRR